MSPLAHHVARQVLRNPLMVNQSDGASLCGKMEMFACFECTAIADLAKVTARSLLEKRQFVTDGVFLPAPYTWIEFKEFFPKRTIELNKWPSDTHIRQAILLCASEDENDVFYSVIGQLDPPNGRLNFLDVTKRPMFGSAAYEPAMRALCDSFDLKNGFTDGDMLNIYVLASVILSLINSRGLLGTKSHPPHRGLERDILKGARGPSSPGLRPWTEITLDLDGAKDRGGSDGVGSGVQRAQHFCRQHLRHVNGKWTRVRWHLRGNPMLGTIRASHVVKRGGGVHAG